MKIKVKTIDAPTGARVTGVDLGKNLDVDTYAEIHQAWLEHQVLVFPDQNISEEDQIRFMVIIVPARGFEPIAGMKLNIVFVEKLGLKGPPC